MATISEFLDTVAEQLRDDGFTVYIEHPDCVVLAAPDATGAEYWWGMVNETWGADLISPYGDLIDGGGLTTDVPSTERDAMTVATAIRRAMRASEVGHAHV